MTLPDLVRLGVCDGPDPGVNDLLARIPLLDHHVHGIVRGALDRDRFLALLSESNRPAAAAAAGTDTQLGIALRRWCAPLLGMAPSVSPEAYLERRLGLANEAAAEALLPAAGFERLLIDTGYRGDELLEPGEMARLAGAPAHAILRLESLAEEVAVSGVPAQGYADAFRSALAERAAASAGLKSVIAYRFGLDFDPRPPSSLEVAAHAGAWLRRIESGGARRLDDQVLLRFGLWEGVATGKPLQLHTGYGDPDLDLHRCDPLLLTGFVRATAGRCDVLLLHTYPYHRQAGYLAEMFEHVFLDVGLAVNHLGARSAQVIAESLELAPFGKILFSSDAWGLPELHLLGSWLFRRGMSRVIGEWVARGDWSMADAERVVHLVASHNARRVYGLEGAD